MKTTIGRLFLAALVLAVVSFFAAPLVAFFALRSAAEAQDVAGLARLVDFGAMRQSLRPQLSGRPADLAPPPSFLEDPIGAIQNQLQRNPIVRTPDVEAYLTPDALAGLTYGEGRDAAEPPAPSATDPYAARRPFPRPRYWGFNRVRMGVPSVEGDETLFTFERRGPFEWKLVHVGLPVDHPSQAPKKP